MVSISVSISIQDTLDAIETTAKREVYQRAEEEAKGVAGDFLAGIIRTLVPIALGSEGGLTSSVINVLSRSNNNGAAGNFSGDLIQGALCEVLGGGNADLVSALHFEVPADRNTGRPTGNGISCGTLDINVGGGDPRFDLLYTPEQPEMLETGGPKSWLVGEFKISVKAMIDKYFYKKDKTGQFSAILNHAADYSYSHSALFLTWRGGTDSNYKKLEGEALKKRVLLFILTIRD